MVWTFDPSLKCVVRQYRRECLKFLSADLNEELDFMDSFSKDNPKNYQIWFHRRAIIELLGDPSRELQFCSEVFEVDSKNYHAWAHRYAVIICLRCCLFAIGNGS